MRLAIPFAMMTLWALCLHGEQTVHGPQDALKGLTWRSIGPAEMGGRTVDIAAIPGDRMDWSGYTI